MSVQFRSLTNPSLILNWVSRSKYWENNIILISDVSWWVRYTWKKWSPGCSVHVCTLFILMKRGDEIHAKLFCCGKICVARFSLRGISLRLKSCIEMVHSLTCRIIPANITLFISGIWKCILKLFLFHINTVSTLLWLRKDWLEEDQQRFEPQRHRICTSIQSNRTR